MADEVRWFESLGRCSRCSRSATGILRGTHNESYGNYCKRCADARLKKAAREREVKCKTNSVPLAPFV